VYKNEERFFLRDGERGYKIESCEGDVTDVWLFTFWVWEHGGETEVE